MVVTMRDALSMEAFAAVGAFEPAFVADENDIAVIWIDAQGAVVERPRGDGGRND